MPKNNSTPIKYLCSITSQVMIDPVVAADGHTYEREAIDQWLQTHDTSPKTNIKLKHKELTENHDKHSDILEFLDSQPELYDCDEIYLPQSWIDQCVKAIKGNQHAIVKQWLNKDRRLLTFKLEGDSTALHLACAFSSPELVDSLLTILKQKNKPIILPGAPRFNPIHFNVLLERELNSGDYAKCELLLKLGAEVEQPETSTQNTLLHRMVIQNNIEPVKWLLSHKALLENSNREGNTPLLLSVIRGNTKLTELLIKMKANLQVKNAQQQSPILIALLNRNKSILRLLLDTEQAALSPLHLGLALNDNAIIKALLKQKVSDIDTRDKQQRTPLYSAVEQGNLEAAKLFLEHGANPSVCCGATQFSTLHIAAERGDVAMLKYLLTTQAVSLIDMRNTNGNTSLHLAAKAGHDHVIPILLKAGAYHKIKNEQGQTPVKLAKHQQKPKTENLIVQTVREFKQMRAKETDRLHQVVAEQASKIMHLELTLQTQGQAFKAQLSNMQSEKAQETSSVQKAVTDQASAIVSLKTSVQTQEQNFQTQFQAFKLQFSGMQSANKQLISTIQAQIGISSMDISAFLTFIAQGEQNKAEAMLEHNPALALVRGNVTDLSSRTFTGITGFQYAVWALDWHMWTMIRKYLPFEQASLQAQEFETGDWVKTHGVNAEGILGALIKAYKVMIAAYKSNAWDSADRAWVTGLGGMQRMLPVHVVNEYCHPTRGLWPIPDFQNDSILPRSRATNIGEWFTAQYNREGFRKGLIGVGFAGAREDMHEAHGWRTRVDEIYRYGEGQEFHKDLKSISMLTTIRTAQYAKLVAELKLAPVSRPERTARYWT